MSFKALFKGALFACIIAAVFLLIFAVLVYFGAVDERIASIGAFAGMAVGGFVGSLVAVGTAGHAPLINALAVSLLCSAAAAAASVWASGGFEPGAGLFSVFACLFGTGILGALFGRRA